MSTQESIATSLLAVTPIDGRYISKTDSLAPYFSEFGLIRYRVQVEVEYFIALTQYGISQLAEFPEDGAEKMQALVEDFTAVEAARIKEIERTTNHDVKAVEYWIKDKMEEAGLSDWKEFVHFGLTSQDVNNTAVPMSIKAAWINCYLPAMQGIRDHLAELVESWKDIPMLARTHGQPASPTALGKEIAVFVERMDRQMSRWEQIPHSGKFGGATGNFNAHSVAYPDRNWAEFGNTFLANHLGLVRQDPTTQIEHYDDMAERFDAMKRLHIILLDFCKDIWAYVSRDYFKQKIVAGEVGSSAMPHKVNPIDFENAEGNLGLANAMLEHLSSKLPISRLQRDLTDSTVSRNIGLPFAYALIAAASIRKGLGKLMVNKEAIAADLQKHNVVLAEAVQTILRRSGYPNPYEALKALTRTNATFTPEIMNAFISELEVDESVREELRALRVETYIGNA